MRDAVISIAGCWLSSPNTLTGARPSSWIVRLNADPHVALDRFGLAQAADARYDFEHFDAGRQRLVGVDHRLVERGQRLLDVDRSLEFDALGDMARALPLRYRLTEHRFERARGA